MNKGTTILRDSIHAISVVMRPLRNKFKSDKNFVNTLLHILSDVDDFRQSRKTEYHLSNILAICLLLALGGEFTSFHGAAECISARASYFRKLGLIQGNKIPSHDTLRYIFMNLDAKSLRDSLIKRVVKMIEQLSSHAGDASSPKIRLICGDGKTFKASGRKGGRRNINVFNLYDATTGVCLASVPLDDKESEITAFRELLRRYNLEHTMVSADALHCQIETMEIITARKGLYTMIVKDNQQSKKEHIIDVLKKNQKKCVSFSHNDCDYEIFVIDYELTEEDFPHAKIYARVISHKRKDQANYNPEPMYFVSSTDNPLLVVETIDNRWALEDGLHLFKDQFLGEDKCTFMDKNAIQVMAIFNNVAYALYRVASAFFEHPSMAFTKYQYKNCPEKLIAQLLPLTKKANITALLKDNMRGRKKARAKA